VRNLWNGYPAPQRDNCKRKRDPRLRGDDELWSFSVVSGNFDIENIGRFEAQYPPQKRLLLGSSGNEQRAASAAAQWRPDFRSLCTTFVIASVAKQSKGDFKPLFATLEM